ncbi:YheU family protein [Desulfococcaceae bacterium HSG8]|nr:YheU family protein [Desulfococcaceae bacterium HSG8]
MVVGQREMNKVVKIPYEQLSPGALQGVIEEFITREGTEYGGKIFSLEQKVSQIRGQLESGKAIITYDEETGTCNIISTEKLKKGVQK